MWTEKLPTNSFKVHICRDSKKMKQSERKNTLGDGEKETGKIHAN